MICARTRGNSKHALTVSYEVCAYIYGEIHRTMMRMHMRTVRAHRETLEIKKNKYDIARALLPQVHD